MGCYLSSPDENVYVTEGRGRKYSYATASCQGWRRDQEDAEAVIPDFEDDASLFILCDGHGGPEVAQYTVEHFPEFLKEQSLYKDGKYKEALEQAFIDFDALLRTPEVHQKLIKLSLDGSEKNNTKEGSEPSKENKSLSMEDGKSNGSSKSDSAIASEEASVSAEAPSTSSSSSSAEPGPSSSSSAGTFSSRPETVADDVDSDTLRKEAQLPLGEVLTGYAGKLGTAYTGSPVVKAKKETSEGESSENMNDPQVSSSSTASITPETMKENLIKQVLQRYFPGKTDIDEFDEEDSSEDDSEFNAAEDDDDEDEDDDEDDDAEISDEDDEDDDEEDSSEDDDDEDEDESEEDSDEEVSGADEETEAEVKGENDVGENKKLSEGHKKPKKRRTNLLSLLAKGQRKKKNKKSKNGDDDSSSDDDEVDSINRLFLTSQVVEKLQLGSKIQNRTHTPGVDSGCTVVVTLVKNNKLYAASAGDSRCILIKRTGDCIPMSIDHKPEDRIEYNRIKEAGGEVIDGRVNSGLNLSRAFGDFSYKNETLPAHKQMITPCPDIRVATIDPENLEYIFLACDGIWNSLNNNQTSKFLMKAAESTDHNLVDMCVELFRKCIAPKTDGDGTGCDNMTCILVRLDKPSESAESVDNVDHEVVTSDSKRDLKILENEEAKKGQQVDSEGTQKDKDLKDSKNSQDELATTNTIKRSNSSSSCTDLLPPKRRCLSL